MRLIASMIVRNEKDRLLPVVLDALSGCDEIRVVDDASDDGTYEWLTNLADFGGKVKVKRNPRPMFAENEGAARQAAFEWTLDGDPSHVLAIDADEFVSDMARVRRELAENPDVPVWSLLVNEVWRADEDLLWLRWDGGWSPSYSPILFRIPDDLDRQDRRWRIPNRKLASGREPFAVVEMAGVGNVVALPVDLLHFGWTNESTRAERHQRYADADAGQFHSSAHLDSILWTTGVKIEALAWPESLDKQAILEACRARAESPV